MKNIIIVALLLGSALMAIDGAKVYEQHCLLCHGKYAEKAPGLSTPLAGRDASRLALEIKAYRDQSDGVGCYTKDKHSQVMEDSTYALTTDHIVALAKYISDLNSCKIHE